jgi:hypothetical protein
MDYVGVTMDYLMVFISWDLNIGDLKKLCQNSLDFATLTDDEKANLQPIFEYKWNRFLDFVLTRG